MFDKFPNTPLSFINSLLEFKLAVIAVIRQVGESQNGGNKKTKPVKFSEKWTFLAPYLCVSGGKKCSFFRKIWRALFSCYLYFEICPSEKPLPLRKKTAKKAESEYGNIRISKNTGFRHCSSCLHKNDSHYVNGNSRPVGILKKSSKFFEKCARKIPTYFWVFFQEARTAVWSKKTLIT